MTDAMVPGATPGVETSASATSGGTATGTTASNPGGAAGYENGPADPLGTVAPGTTNVFQGLTVPSGNMPTNLPTNLENLEFGSIITQPGQPGEAVGTGKGATRPDLTRLSDLVKFAAGLAMSMQTGHIALGKLNPATISDVLKNSGFSDKDREAFMRIASAAGTQTGATAENTVGLKIDQNVMSQVFPTLWKSIINHVQALGISVPKDEQQAPNSANMLTKLNALGGLRLEQPTLDALERQGYDTKGMTNVSSLVSGHDAIQFARGAPGTTAALAPVPQQTTKETGAKIWDQFVNKWNSNPTTNGQDYRTSIVNALVGSGAMDISGGGTISLQQVQTAYQRVMQQAAQDNMSVEQELAKISGSLPTGPGGVALSNMNLDQAYVMHLADQILGPNSITPYQAQALSNVASKEGTGTSAAADLINEGIVSLYNPNNPPTSGASFAAIAYQAANDTLAQWGIPSNPTAIANIVKQALVTGVSTPYQVTSLATNAAEAYAKQTVGTLYGQGVGAQANAGISVQNQASPYMATAADLLGVPAGEMNVADPTGKWMKWSQGGTGPGGTMTQAEWAQYLMKDPSYGFDQSKTAVDTMAAGANGLLSLFGKLPNTAPNPFQGTGVSLPTVGA